MRSRRALLPAFFGGLLLSADARAKKKKKNKGEAVQTGVIGGTVFDSNRRSLPGAKVSVYEVSEPKKKRGQAICDRRGEFAVRLPAGEQFEYVVRVEAKRFATAERKSQVYIGERVNLNFVLDLEP